VGVGVGLGVGFTVGVGVAEGLADRSASFDGDGEGCLVEDASGFDSCVVASAAVIGRARGGSYAVPAITVCTPHHDSVTAAPVASDQASTCTSPLRIAAILPHASHRCPARVHKSGVVHRPGPRFAAWRTVRRMASVLVVEDDQFVRSALIRHLTDAAHTVRSVGTALEALREVAHFSFDVVILDLGLPDLDGSEALKMLRGITDVPVIIATARDDETEIVRLLNAGADDYLTKPFSVEHLSARMAAVLRRARSAPADTPPSAVLSVGGLTVDPLRRQAELDGARLDLTRREFDLLAFLAGRPGVVVPRKELLAEVWQQSYGDDQTIDVHLSWLRRKLGETAARPRYLHTLRGVGVKLEPPGGEPPR
jgi:DNA-binding response OmpR family regulator